MSCYRICRTCFRFNIKTKVLHCNQIKQWNIQICKNFSTSIPKQAPISMPKNNDFDNLEEIKNLDIDKLNETEHDAISLEYYVNKAELDLDIEDKLNDDTSLYTPNQLMYFKIIDIWINEIGNTRKSHRDFVKILLQNMEKFDVQYEPEAYLRLIDCFPKGEHTEIKRDKWMVKAFQGKRPDHILGVNIFRIMKYNNVESVESMFEKCEELFGKWSLATLQIRRLLFWQPRFRNLHHNPVSPKEVACMSPIEISFWGMRQMNPGLDAVYKKIKSDKTPGYLLISSQIPNQIKSLDEHDINQPLYVEGPQLMYYHGKRVNYYTLYKDPLNKIKSEERVTILTDKEWWELHYQTDFATERKTYNKKFYSEDEKFFPSLRMHSDIGIIKNKWYKEVEIVENDTKSVEGEVFAIASITTGDHDPNMLPLLKNWMTSLQKDNPILSQVTVLFREKDTFLTIGQKTDQTKQIEEIKNEN